MTRIASFFRLLALSRISLFGAALVTSCILANIILIAGELFLFESNPYMGIFVYMVFPGLAMLGLFLIPVGVLLTARRARRRLGEGGVEKLIAQRRVNRMHVFQIVFLLSMVNLVIFGIIGYRGFHFTESKEFCGELCHEVMHPELTAYSRSPHSEISCVECHIGEGAGWFVKSKLSGLRQVLAVLRNSYSRPIETPIHNLRPAREVCEVCHRPEIFHGNRIEIIEHFEPDEVNTRTYTVLNMRVGSGGEHGRDAHGIHWHVSREHEVRYYAADRKRENVVWIELTKPDGSKDVWTRPGFDIAEEELNPDEVRLMDCVDCHNRPTHIFLSPEEALDDWMENDLIDPSIPWIRKISEEFLRKPYASKREAMAGLATLPEAYQARFPEHWEGHGEKLASVVPQLQEIYGLFVYPDMNIQWNTYNSLISHPTPHTAGCFRCHDGVLSNEKGETITMECDSCHYVLANRAKTAPILSTLEGK